MAANVEFLASEATIQVLGQDIVRDAQRYTFRSRASGTVFSLLISPPTQFTPEQVGQLADSLALNFDYIARRPGCVGVQQVQEVDVLNQLHDHLLIGVESTSGLSSSILNWAALPTDTGLIDAWIAEERARLDAIERL